VGSGILDTKNHLSSNLGDPHGRVFMEVLEAMDAYIVQWLVPTVQTVLLMNIFNL